MFCFFPETNQLELEDVDHLFEAGGVTGGVLRSRGKTVQRRHHERHVDGKLEMMAQVDYARQV